MSPTTPQRFSSSAEPLPNLREQARMQASTASACLRRLSDWVNSVSKLHACSLVTMSDILDHCPLLIVLSQIVLPQIRESSSPSASPEDASQSPRPCR